MLLVIVIHKQNSISTKKPNGCFASFQADQQNIRVFLLVFFACRSTRFTRIKEAVKTLKSNFYRDGSNAKEAVSKGR